MASTTEQIRQRMRSFYDGLNPREQRLLKIMVVVVSLAAVTIVGLLIDASMGEVESTIESRKEALATLAEVAPRFRGQQKQDGESNDSKFAPEKIEGNDLQLTSFVAGHATAVGVQVDSYDESERPIGGDDDDSEEASLYEHEVTVKIRDAEVEKLMTMLERIETSDEPASVERITFNRKRRDKGKVRASLVVTTFRRKGQG